MPVTVLPEQESGQHLIAEQLIVSPYTPAWWIAQVITNIPNDSVGWLVAQGWNVTGVTYDNTTQPPTPYYTMARKSLQNWTILESLLESYVTAHNTATTHNATRYNDVVQSWDALLDNAHAYYTEQGEERDAQAVLFLANLDSYMDEVDGLISADASSLGADNTLAAAALSTQSATVAILATDYSTHATASPQYLIDLGSTDLCRINEAFNASHSTQVQQLMDRGFYMSSIATDIQARNTRDRDEQIQLLNDRLNREKLENEHRLYEQKVAMRNNVIGGKERYSSLTMQRAQVMTDQRHRAIVAKMNVSAARLSGLRDQQAQNMELMKYWLDDRNKLIIGLYGFVERREDSYPEFRDLVVLATGLGDAGGGWVSP